MADLDEEDFNIITPSLIKQLQSILYQYPDGGQILKEILQNAEDAKASKVCFLYDETQYGTDPEKLHCPDLANFQGPALYAYNDAQFSEKDWRGIRSLHQSGKEKEPLQVGRFGLGFKSVFHMTDLPSILSGNRLAVIDPHEKYFTLNDEKSTGYSWLLPRRWSTLQKTPHQYEPFLGVFGCDENALSSGTFRGTIFRFPLRNQPSKLSNNIYSHEKVKNLFQTFQTEACMLLMFLKHVVSVEVLHRKSGCTEPELVFKVEVNTRCLDLVLGKRQEFLGSLATDTWMDEPVQTVYPLQIVYTKKEEGQYSCINRQYLVCEYYAGGEATEPLKSLHNDSHIPLVGIAMPIEQFGTSRATPDDNERANGQLFCFLPLPSEKPTETGLPVHINGYFAVSQNRHSLKLPTKGQDIEADPDILWNHTLMAELIPQAYKSLLLAAVEFAQTLGDYGILPQDVISSVPDISQVLEPWTTVLEPLMTSLIQEPIFFSSMPSEAQSGWVRLQEAVLTDMHDEAEHLASVKSVLRAGGIHVIDCPPHLIHAVQTYSSVQPEGLAPSLVKDTLCSKPELLEALEHHQKLDILAYLLEEGFDLTGLTLLPTADGKFVPFAQKGSHHVIYYAKDVTERALLLRRPAWLLALDLPGKMATQLEDLAEHGTTQLVPFRPDMLLTLLPALLPNSWDTAQSHCIEQEDQAWVTELWKYIRQHFPDDISHLRGLPILPVHNEDGIAVVSLVSPSKILLKSSLNHCLSDDCQRALQAIGVVVVKGISLGAESHAGVIGKYILPPDTLNTFLAASEIYRTEGNAAIQRFIVNSSEKDKLGLQKLWSQLSEDELLEGKVFLSELPLFELLGKDPVVFRSRSNVPIGGPQESLPLSPSREMLDLRQHDARLLATKLGLEPMTMAEFFISEVFCKPNFLAAQQTKEIIDFFILNWNQLAQDKNFVSHLERFPFVEDMLGQQVIASSLFDPEDPFLYKLFYGEAVFPASSLRESKYIAFFRKLGLLSKQSITAEHILKSASIVHEECGSISSNSLRDKAEAVKEHLQGNHTLLNESINGSTLQGVLFNLRWLLPAERKCDYYPFNMPWFETQAFVSPAESCSWAWRFILGGIVPVVDVQAEFAASLHMRQEPDTSLVVKQLKLVQQTYTPHEKATYLNIVGCIYEQLKNGHPDHLSNYLQDQDLQNWIWTGDGFASVEQVVIEKFQFDLSPYCVPLPQELLDQHKDFFLGMGVEEYVTNGRLVHILKQIQALHEDCEKEAQGNVSRDLQLAVDVLNFIAQIIDDLHDEIILIPVATEHPGTLVLRPTTECAYRDDWVDQDEIHVDDDNKQIYLVHEKVPWNIAQQLGVPSLMTRLLKGEDFMIGFGQIESLTNRLKSLLEDYSDGLSIPKEMIQNADDAKATTVKFMYDERENLDKLAHLIHPGMAGSQGPALWVYNDAMFTEEDFNNLTNLGGATKENEPDKIGNFGLGFNAVYNITDVPSVVSGSSLVIFDPNMSNLGPSVSERGVQIKLKGTRLLHKISDQIAPFLDVFGYTQDRYMGTLFRLPLRTKKQALGSAICSKPYDRHEMLELIKMVLDNAENMILFTQSVTNVEMYHMPKFEQDPKKALKLFSVKRTVEGQITQKGIETLTTQFFSVLSEDPVPGKENTAVVDIHFRVYEDIDLSISAMEKSQKWAVSRSHGSGMSEASKKSESFISVAEIAIPLKYEVQGSSKNWRPVPLQSIDREGILFCFLPLPISTGLPVHINAPFAVHSNRRGIFQLTYDDKQCPKAEWNKALLSDAVIHAYGRLIMDLGTYLQNEKIQFVDLWPNCSSVCSVPDFWPFLDVFYQQLLDGYIPAACIGSKYITLQDAVFLDPVLRYDATISSYVLDILEKVDLKGHFVDLPESIRQSFIDTGHQKFIEEKTITVASFFCEIVLPNLELIDADARNRLLLYAIDFFILNWNQLAQDKNFVSHLERFPFVEDMLGQQVIASSLFDPEDPFLNKLFHGEAVFPASSLRESKYIAFFRKLGLRSKQSITAEHILKSARIVHEECGSISSNSLRDKAEAVKEHLQGNHTLLNDIINGSTLQEVLFNLRWLLPTERKCEYYPFSMPWFETQAFVSPAESCSWAWRFILGGIVPVVDVQAEFAASLHMRQEPDTSLVLKQLKLVQQTYTPHEKATYLNIVGCIYEQLKDGHPDHLSNYLQDQDLQNWIWTGDGFASVEQVVIEKFQFDLSPYCVPLPQELLDQHKDFFLGMGVEEYVTNGRLVHILKQIQALHEDCEKEAQGNVSRDLQLAVDVLNFIAQIIDDLHDEIILIPVATEHPGTLVLRPTTECAYRDDWVDQDEIHVDDDNKQIYLVHEKVPWNIAQQLGVPSLMTRLLKGEDFMIGFGQIESLTNRLKSLLEDYSDGLSIPKEMIQNADDAKATTVKFMYDERENLDKLAHLIHPGMAGSQGPALWVYNDAMFTEEDFNNLTNLGGATKENEPDKIGNFGLGFNAVYNITDVPSVVSGSSLVIFDPNMSNLGPSVSERGVRISLKGTRLLHKISDQIAPFLDVFGYTQDRYMGTLFRLPLRTKKQALGSAICSKPYDRHEMLELIKMVLDNAENMILFTQSVTNVEMYHMPKFEQDPKKALKLFSVKRTVEGQITQKGIETLTTQFFNVLSEVISEDPVPDKGNTAVVDIHLRVYEDIDLNIGAVEKSQKWAVSRSHGSGTSEDFKKSKSFVSVAEIAIPLKYEVQGSNNWRPVSLQSINREGILFCFLPLPISTGLPVHINAPFAVHFNRRGIFQLTYDDKQCPKAEWNKALLSDAVINAYGRLIMDIGTYLQNETIRFVDLWPDCSSVCSVPDFWPFLEVFYKQLADGYIPAACIGNEYITLQDAVFLDPVLRHDATISSYALDILEKVDLKGHFIDFPESIRQSFIDTGHQKFIEEKTITVASFFCEIVLPNLELIDADARNRLLLYAIETNNKEIQANITVAPCIPVSPDGKYLKCPGDLIDPLGTAASIFTDKDGRFPHGEFSQPKYLLALEEMGMQKDDLMWSDILERANHISSLYENHDDPEKLQSLWKFVEKKLSNMEPSDVDTSEEVETLRRVRLIPIKAKPDYYPLLWKGEQIPHGSLMAAEELCFERNLDLVIGSVLIIADLSDMPPKLETVLKVGSKQVTANVVIEHIDNTIHTCPSIIDYESQRELERISHNSFRILQRHCQMEASLTDQIREHFQDQKCILVNKEYVLPRQAAFKTALVCPPYIQELPAWAASDLVHIMETLGVHEEFHKEHYIEALQYLHDDTIGTPLDEEMLKKVIDLIHHVLDSKHGCSLGKDIDLSELYVPDASGVLHQPGMLCYNDKSWLHIRSGLFGLDEEDVMKLVHPLIPLEMAEKLRIPSYMTRLLDAEDLEVCGFGQEEKLTTRLRNLLQDYTDGFSIPKELLQNADDAGATVIKFLYDERSNKDNMESLIDEGMKDCQGPAFWSYNDANFTEDDFENIIQLGAATKESKPNKIGKFGLGFNAVYNVTDVPSIISGGSLVIFDPNRHHLGKALDKFNSAGLRINMTKKHRIQNIPDQLEPYHNVFGYNTSTLGSSFEGTLFRLPLRTEKQAKNSLICNKPYDDKEMQSLLKLFVESGESLLLFTQSVSRIELHHLPKHEVDARNAVMICSIQRQIEGENKVLPYGSLQAPTCHPGTFFHVLDEGMAMMESSGTGKLQQSDRTVKINITHELYDNAQVLLHQRADRKTQKWAISKCVGSGKALQIAQKKALVPIASVAVALQAEGEDYLPVPLSSIKSEGQLFCFLPLPVQTGLPLHVNGPFAVQSNRRDICQHTVDDKEHTKADWNAALMEDAVVDAYVHVLEDVAGSKNHITKLLKLWPDTTNMEERAEPVVSHFYRNVASGKRVPAECRNGDIITLENAVFLDPSLKQNDSICQHAVEVLKVVDTQHHYIDLPDEIIRSFHDTGYSQFIEERMYTEKIFFINLVLPNLINIEDNVRNNLVLHALRKKDEDIFPTLKGIPCIPASPDGKTLKCPHELIHPHGAAAKLFTEEDGRFPHGSFCYDHILLSLNELGMLKNDLTWPGVIERTEKVASLQRVEGKDDMERIHALCRYINEKLKKMPDSAEGEDVDDVAIKLRNIKFLPLHVKPPNHPVKWKGDEVETGQLMAANEMYPQTKMNIVSSTQFIAVDRMIGELFMEFLGLHEKPVPVDIIFYQLRNALQVDPQRLRHDSMQKLVGILRAVFTYLQEHCLDNEDYDGRFAELSDMKCILTENSFAYPCNVAYDFQSNHCASLCQLPKVWADKKLKPLMEALGVKQNFTEVDYIMALQKIHEHSNGKPLKDEIFKASVELLNILAYKIHNKIDLEQFTKERGSIFIPDSYQVLKPANTLCFNDCPWLPKKEDDIAHSMVPHLTAYRLGVKTLKQEVLSHCSFGIPFGQKQRLTVSISRILKNYPSGSDVMKELLQNADDAKATKIHFILDHRTHKKERLFDDKWAPLQGPSLCIYNNSGFSNSDIEGIQMVREGSKEYDPNKTGQYGIGFNSVYHFTDAPSFLTAGDEIGEVLCVFDPQCKYVPSATDASPGCMYKELSKLRHCFPDIFECYLEDILPQDHRIGGTVFRLPLRNKKMAESSELSTEEITCEKVRIELSKLKKEAFSALLFMNNLKEISISEIPAEGQACLTNTYTVTCLQSTDTGTCKFNDSYAAYRCHVKSAGQALKTGQMQLSSIEVCETVYNVKVQDTEHRSEFWRISQRLGISDDSSIPGDVTKAFERQDICLTPRGGVAYRLQPKRLLVQAYKTKTPKMGVSCFLPLPIKTCLPVHINGHFALGHESRQHLWTNREYDGYRWTWNEFLCREVIAPAYVNLILSLRNDIIPGKNSAYAALTRSMYEELEEYVQAYQVLFPLRSEGEEPWHTLITAVYQEAIKRKAEVLPTIQEGSSLSGQWGQMIPSFYIKWLPPCPVSGLSLYLTTYVTQELALLHVLRRCGMHVVCMKSHVLTEFETAEISVPKVSPGTVLSYFSAKGRVLLNVPRALKDTPLRDLSSLTTILEYIMQEENYQNEMQNLPLCLTADGVLREYDAEQPVIRLPPKPETLRSYLPAFMTGKTPPYLSFLCRKDEIISECGASILHCELARRLTQDSHPQFLREKTITDIANMLPHCLPAHVYYGQNDILWDRKAISQDWLLEFWQCVLDLVTKTTKLPLEKMGLEHLRTVVAPLSSWSLMPVKVGSQTYLKSVIHAAEVINPDTLANSDFWTQVRKGNMLHIFYAAQIPLLDTINMGQFNRFFGRFTTALQHPVKVLEIIHAKKQKLTTYLNSSTKHSEERQTLLDYFSKNLEELRGSDNAILHLRELPLFRTKNGDYIPLNKSCVYIIPADIPMDDMDVWTSKEGVVFLEEVAALKDMHKFMGCAALTASNVYCDFILKHFVYLTENGRNKHLYHLYWTYLVLTEPNKYIHKHEVQRKEDGFTLLAVLKTIPILPGADGQLQLATCFYDPENHLFKRMLPKMAFPPEVKRPFQRNTDWLHLFRMLGMVQELTNQLAVMFAKQIAFQPQIQWNDKAEEERARKQSKTFIQYILQMTNEQLQHDLLHAVKDIPFICPNPASIRLLKLYAQYGMQGNSKMPFIRFRDGYHWKYENEIWTVAYLLPEWAIPHGKSKDQLMQMLGMTLEPPVELIVNNLSTVSHHITCREELHVSEYCDIWKSIYSHLQERLETLTTTSVWPDMVEQLQGVPCIVTNGEKSLIEPGKAVLNMYDHDEIQPYLCKVSPQFGEFQTLFKALKCADIATVEQFAGVLDQINCDVSKVKQAGSQEKEKLTANELVLAYKAIKGLFLTLENTKEIENISLNKLYLPSKEGQLVFTVNLLYNDCPAYYARVQHLGIPLLFDMRECGLTHRHQKELLDLLPKNVAVGLLSTHVKEHLLPSLKVDRHDNSITQELTARLRCEPFRTAVRRLIRHEANRGSRIRDDRKIDDMIEPLSVIKVYAINDLQTELHYKGKPIKGSQSHKRILCEKGPVVYIQTGTLDNKLLVTLAAIVNGILGDVLPSSVLHLLVLMSCPLEDMQHELDECNIGSDNKDTALFAPTLPSPGSVIPTDQKQWVQMRPGGTFEANEYVAFKELGADFVYAVCKAPHDGSLNPLDIIVGPCQDCRVVFPSQLHKIKRKLEY